MKTYNKGVGNIKRMHVAYAKLWCSVYYCEQYGTQAPSVSKC